MRGRRIAVILLAAVLGCPGGVAAGRARSVPLCTGVTLAASYLVETAPGQGPGFRFVLDNRTGREVRLAEPVPSSAHWYARSGDRWLWRASSGGGGSLVDATREHGPVVVYENPPGASQPKLITVPPHQSRVWVAGEAENPVLAYQPRCQLCSYPGEHQYRVVFAYAYLGRSGQDLLSCGLRSAPVPMPPKF